MKALLVCATFGRIPYLPTMLAGFLNQNYDDKHLVIINDDVNVELCCDYDNVTVINCNKRLLISDKRNIGISSGPYDIIFPYDDDDIFLPNRLSHHISQYENDDVNAFRNTAAYILHGQKFTTCGGSMNDISFRKSEWFKIGGYTRREMTGEDTELSDSMSNKKFVNDPSNMNFIYGWSGINYHTSSGHSVDYIDKKAHEQLVELGLLNKKYHIVPDHHEYEKYLKLVSMYEKNKVDIPIKHAKMGEIDISHLL